MKAILPIFLTSYLLYSENRATTIIHSFNFMAYFCSLFGTSNLADALFRRYPVGLVAGQVYNNSDPELRLLRWKRLPGRYLLPGYDR